MSTPLESGLDRLTINADQSDADPSPPEIWYLKTIEFTSSDVTRRYNIITQNYNGSVVQSISAYLNSLTTHSQ